MEHEDGLTDEERLLLTTTTVVSSNDSSASPATRVVILSTLVAVCGSYVFGSAVDFSSPAQTGIMNDLGLSLEEYSVFGSIMTIGAMIGAVMSGKIADHIGRRMTMGLSQMFCLLGWLSIFYSEVSWLLDAGRLSIGYGIGVLSYVVPVYVAEITPQNLRGAFSTANHLMICIGMSVMWLIGIVTPWCTLALIGTIPCILQILGLCFIPESPRWLAKIGWWEGCESALQRLRGENAKISKEAVEIRLLYPAASQFFMASIHIGGKWRVPFGPGAVLVPATHPVRAIAPVKYLYKTHFAHARGRTPVLSLFTCVGHASQVGVGLMILQQFGGVNSIAFYANSIFISAGFSSRIGTIALVVVQVPLILVGVLLMDVSGRRALLMISAAGTCLGCFFTGMSFLLQDLQEYKVISPILALVGVMVFKGSFSLGMGGIPWVIMSEIFPMTIKSSAGSLVTVVNWSGSCLVTYFFNILMKYSTEGTFFLFSSISSITILFVAKLVPETKGQTLEEIQTSMSPIKEN